MQNFEIKTLYDVSNQLDMLGNDLQYICSSFEIIINSMGTHIDFCENKDTAELKQAQAMLLYNNAANYYYGLALLSKNMQDLKIKTDILSSEALKNFNDIKNFESLGG